MQDDDILEDYGVFHEGQFSVSKEQVRRNLVANGVPEHDFTLIEGFYSDSLVRQDTVDKVGSSNAGIVHIDCDLYNSALPCLDFINLRLVDGAIIMFDDWFCYRGRPDKGVRKAFEEWSPSSGYIFTEYSKYSWSGIMFICSKRL